VKLSTRPFDLENSQLESIIEESKEEGGVFEDTLLFSLSASNAVKKDFKNRKVGTPFYLAPELWLTETNNLCSKQSDIWSLGVILYELCTQKKPFMAQDIATL
jgi:serine/threonine protein kinase